MIATVVPRELRQRYFGVNFTLLNLGIGIGGIVGGLFVDVDRAGTFQAIYLVDAVTYLPGAAAPARCRCATSPGRSRRRPRRRSAAAIGYLAVLRQPGGRDHDAAQLRVVVRRLLPAQRRHARRTPAAIGEVSTRGLGLAFAANTLVIVVLQLVVLQRIEGRRRTRVIAVMGVVWAVLVAAARRSPGWSPAPRRDPAGRRRAPRCSRFGETLLQPTIPALVNDLAPDHLRGRYNALSSGTFQLAADHRAADRRAS